MKGIAAAAGFAIRACAVACWLVGPLVLAGCGQTGPLFLPEGETKVAVPPAPQPGTEPASEETTKKKEEPR